MAVEPGGHFPVGPAKVSLTCVCPMERGVTGGQLLRHCSCHRLDELAHDVSQEAGCLSGREVRDTLQCCRSGLASAGDYSLCHFLCERRRSHGVLDTGNGLRWDTDAAEVGADVEAGQGLTAEGVAEAVGIAGRAASGC